MYCRAQHALLAVALTLAPHVAAAQAVWQPTPPPLVTAENESWYRAGSPIEWNGDFYYPAGAPQAFDPYVMVRAGSYRGIPLYMDTTLEPYSIVFVPIAGSRMQPYEHLRAGMLADTTGSRTPWFPPQTSAALDVLAGGFVAQAPAPPMFARPYDLTASHAPAPAPAPVGTTGVAAPVPPPTGTSGRAIDTRPASTAIPPKGINNAWIEYDGRRWVAGGKAIARASDMHVIGEYHGFSVYARGNDRSTIFVPSTSDLVVPFVKR
jgi:hypothetical protein